MLKIDANYTDYRDDTDPDYPFGKAIPASTTDSTDGTPWLDKMFNDLHGARTAIFKKAFGNTRQPLNIPDNIENSDTLDAILKLIQDAFSLRLFSVEISGTETVVNWETLGVSYDPEKRYAAIATPLGNYEEFLPFGTECKNDGLHIYPRRLINGKIVPGTRHKKWGTRKWGIGKWNDYDTMRVNLQFQEIL
ncbi:MAG: hypothetical protein J6T20_04760 [Treponema sp.]|nr:hypothetical protein [Treponema sp.]